MADSLQSLRRPNLYLLNVAGAILVALFNRWFDFPLQAWETAWLLALFSDSSPYSFSIYRLLSADCFAPSTGLNIFTHNLSLGVEE
jgi:hypothetical protein